MSAHRMNGLIAAIVIGTLACFSAAARAGLGPLESLVVNQSAHNVTFTIDFGHAPDFYTTDSFGRPADSFQINIAPLNGNPAAFPSVVVRGDEIQYTNGIVVRNATPPSSDPHSGGWGSVRGTVPYILNGNEITFSDGFGQLEAPKGQFSYDLYTLHYGTTVGQTQGQSVPLPAPATVGLGMLLVLGIAMTFGRNRVLAAMR